MTNAQLLAIANDLERHIALAIGDTSSQKVAYILKSLEHIHDAAIDSALHEITRFSGHALSLLKKQGPN